MKLKLLEYKELTHKILLLPKDDNVRSKLLKEREIIGEIFEDIAGLN